jgi:2-C-methyl-D-erythritol 4-phosphate cytidylyltransferase
LIPGNPENIKVTTPEDLLIARAFVQEFAARPNESR